MSNPFVSVLMCSYNSRRYIEKAVTSVLRQSYKRIELLVSDDYSSDGTWEWLAENLKGHSQVTLHRNNFNVGQVQNKNFLLSRAIGDLIIQCDSDDYFEESLITRQVSVMAARPEIAIVASGYCLVTDGGEIFQVVAPETNRIISRYDGSSYPFWFPSLLVKREVYDEIGNFSPILLIGEDLYWVVKANERYPIYCLSDPLYFYRQTSGSVTRRLNNDRKLVATALLSEILQQRGKRGTDWIEKGDTASIRAFELALFSNRKFMAEQYRVWAAKALDSGDFGGAATLLAKAARSNPLNKALLRTVSYYLRARFRTLLANPT